MLKLARKKLAAAALLSFGAALAQPALAATYSYSFTELASGGTIAPVAGLSISDVAGGAEFTLTGSFGWLPGSAFLSKLWFNGPAGTVTPIAGNTFAQVPETDPQINAGYSFSWDAAYPTAGSPGSDRFLATDTSTWQITGSGIVAASFSRPMMVHIQGLEGNTLSLDTSIKVLSPVPEPSALMMLLAGLGLMGLTARRRD